MFLLLNSIDYWDIVANVTAKNKGIQGQIQSCNLAQNILQNTWLGIELWYLDSRYHILTTDNDSYANTAVNVEKMTFFPHQVSMSIYAH